MTWKLKIMARRASRLERYHQKMMNSRVETYAFWDRFYRLQELIERMNEDGEFMFGEDEWNAALNGAAWDLFEDSAW